MWFDFPENARKAKAIRVAIQLEPKTVTAR
jgi:hypothetical protein